MSQSIGIPDAYEEQYCGAFKFSIFNPMFSGIGDEQLKLLSVAGYLLYMAVIQNDYLNDDALITNTKEKLVLTKRINVCNTEARK